MARVTVKELEAKIAKLEAELLDCVDTIEDLEDQAARQHTDLNRVLDRAEKAEQELTLSRTVNGNLLEVLTNVSRALR